MEYLLTNMEYLLTNMEYLLTKLEYLLTNININLDCMKILLYNNHERITKDIASLMQDAEIENNEQEDPEEEYLIAITLDSL